VGGKFGIFPKGKTSHFVKGLLDQYKHLANPPILTYANNLLKPIRTLWNAYRLMVEAELKPLPSRYRLHAVITDHRKPEKRLKRGKISNRKRGWKGNK
jgi:hypothetical protein